MPEKTINFSTLANLFDMFSLLSDFDKGRLVGMSDALASIRSKDELCELASQQFKED